MHCPDNYDIWASHEADVERRRAVRPICDCCYEPIIGERLFDIDGELFCMECVKENFIKDTDDYIQA